MTFISYYFRPIYDNPYLRWFNKILLLILQFSRFIEVGLGNNWNFIDISVIGEAQYDIEDQ